MSIMTITDANGKNRDNVIIESATPNGKWIFAIHGSFGSPDQMRVTSQLESLFPNRDICFPKGDNVIPDGQGGFGLGWRIKDDEKIDNRFLADSLEQFLKARGLSYKDGAIVGISGGCMAAMRLISHIDEMNIDSFVGISGSYNSPETFDYKGRALLINHKLDKIVPRDGNASFNSVTDTINLIDSNVRIFEMVSLSEAVADPDFNYHGWDEIRSLYNLNKKLVEFIGA